MGKKTNQPGRPTLPAVPTLGKDEMNLAEFPIGKLGVRDNRESLTYAGWFTDKAGKRFRQKWVVSGSKEYGLPHELGNRILVIFITLAAAQQSKQVSFVDHQVLKLLRLSRGKANYQHFERNLLQLAGLTIYSEQALWDHAQKRHVTTKRAFHIFEDVWLSSWTDDTRRGPRGHGYVVFNDVFWRNIESGYLKSLNMELYLGTLKSSIARQLYRCLDKLMRYRAEFEIDVFDLAGRIGLQKYAYPSKIKEKLEPALRELTAIGFLESVMYVKLGEYTRLRFVKGRVSKAPGQAELTGAGQAAAEGVAEAAAEVAEVAAAPADTWQQIQARYGIDPAYQELWGKVLANIKTRVRPTLFDSFVEHTLLQSIDAGVATILVGNAQAMDWLQNRFAKQFRDELNYYLRQDGKPLVATVQVVAMAEPWDEGGAAVS